MDNGVAVLAMVYGRGEQADLTMARRKNIAAALQVISEQFVVQHQPMDRVDVPVSLC